MNPRLCRYLLMMLLVPGGHALRAQELGAGISAVLVSPNGDLGQYYKKSPGYGVFLYQTMYDGRLKVSIGLTHTSTTARMDTVPDYAVQYSNSGQVVLPGYIAYGKFNMNYVNSCVSLRLVHFHGLSLFVGAGIEGGQSHISYSKTIETVLIEPNASFDYSIAGLLVSSSIDYKLGSNFVISLDGRNNVMYITDWSANYTHYTLGIYVNYIFNRE